MPPTPAAVDAAVAAAREAFRPDRFGFRPHRGGWLRETGGGAVAVAPLGWQHAHAAPERDGAPSALALLVDLQARTWGMPPEEVLPANLLAVLPETGGSVLAAYDPALGFTDAGWLGFAIALGGRGGTLVSHMLGVREEARGARNLGRDLKLLQAHEALRSGHSAAVWTFDPMRGANARLNLGKLGAGIEAFTVDKYGALRSDLYGPVPSDRLTARWDLLAPATAACLRAAGEGHSPARTDDDRADAPDVTPGCLARALRERPPRLRYRIPADIDDLMRRDPRGAIGWRREMREVFSALLTTRRVRPDDGSDADPLAIGVHEEPGAYAITGFRTGLGADGERASYYVLDRIDHGEARG